MPSTGTVLTPYYKHVESPRSDTRRSPLPIAGSIISAITLFLSHGPSYISDVFWPDSLWKAENVRVAEISHTIRYATIRLGTYDRSKPVVINPETVSEFKYLQDNTIQVLSESINSLA